MQQTEAFGQPLVPEPGFIPRAIPSAEEIARRDAEYHATDEADPDDIVGVVPPEHSWPGTALVWAMCAAGLFAVVRMAFLLLDIGDMTLPQVLGTLPMMLFPGAVLLWTARKIHTFRLTGLGIALFLLLGSLVGDLRLLRGADDLVDVGFAVLAAGAAVLWISYLWARRSDFS
jgi:hypothetical protein